MNINDPKFHPFYQFRNQEVNWLSTDSEQAFNHNLKSSRVQLEEYGWLERKITYKFNSEGFRCEEFAPVDCMVFLGSSIPMGIGLPVNQIYPTIVANQLGLKPYNLALGGTSNDTAFRIGLHWISKLNPKIVVFDSEFAERFELLTSYSYKHFIPSVVDDSFYRTWLSAEENSYLNKQKNVLATQALCTTLGIKFVNIDPANNKGPKHGSMARDLLHPGTLNHKHTAYNLLKLIDKA